MYDAVWLYARVLDSLIRKDKSLVQVNGEKSKIVSNFPLSGFALWWHNGRICIWDEKARLHWSVWQVASTMIWNFKWLLENNLLFNSSWQTTPNTTYLSYLYPTHPWSFRVNFHSGHSRLSEIRIMQVCKKNWQNIKHEMMFESSSVEPWTWRKWTSRHESQPDRPLQT